MVYTLVLEANAERIESSSLSWRTTIWGISSAGRAAALQAVGRRFEPCILHQGINMTSIRIIPKYTDNLWYPIVVKSSAGGTRIVEMLGKEVNEHNKNLWKHENLGITLH